MYIIKEGNKNLRVISGKARGIKLESLEGEATRPTLDRIKESLFNIIQFELPNAIVLDLFAGSGSLGIESLSRGAKEVVFCDNSIFAIKVINSNIEKTKFAEDSEVINKDYILALKEIAKQNKKFDIIFLDPPYNTDFAKKALDLIIEMDLLSDDGIIIIETDDKDIEEKVETIEDIKIFNIRKYGRVLLMFIRRS
ncbi:MAG: 16S rRNA (guanine(966)-N(2))-methyltransferase RsmD [Oscillospiraceae bacterium]|nr:16S rRNA (guanine(966)-N(2))-methyltransferase RsmD [Oscillospiraceae bacterium]